MFVGDVPPGCGHYELQELFSQLANVVNIKHLEHKSIAFVTVESDAEVGHIIEVADTSGLHIHGTMIRVARAHHPSDGKVLPQPLCQHSQHALIRHCSPCKAQQGGVALYTQECHAMPSQPAQNWLSGGMWEDCTERSQMM